MADFVLVSRRTLSESEYTLFKFHFLLGADWSLCCRRLKMDRGAFFHEVYRIQQKLGRTFRELEPHALFPLDQYFGGGTRQTDVRETGNGEEFPVATAKAAPVGRKVLNFPVKKAA